MKGPQYLTAALIVGQITAALAASPTTVRFEGKVSDGKTNPISGVAITINRVSGAPLEASIEDIKTNTQIDGRFELPLNLRASKAKTVNCELWFTRPGYVRNEKTVQFPANTNWIEFLDVTLAPGELLSGIVSPNPRRRKEADTTTRPESGRQVFTVSDGKWEQVFVAAADGGFQIYVPPGEYKVSVITGRPFEVAGIKSGTTNLVIAPPQFLWNEASVGAVFDQFWQEMDRHYSYFFLKTNVDWAALRAQYRPVAVQATNPAALAATLKNILSPLRDLHVWIETPEGTVGTYASSYSFNGNGMATRQAISETAPCGKFAVVGRTKADNFGYFLMLRQSNATQALVRQAVVAIQQLADAPGFIVDLRAANGGSEPFAQEIASCFCSTNTVYAKSKYRGGPRHTDFGPENERVLPASSNAFTKPIVCIIGPGAVSSGEGFVKMMKALPHVTTIGMPTRGASGNPKPYPLGQTGITVMFSRWVDLLPNGETFEGRGIPPDIEVNEPVSAYTNNDPTLAKAITILREKISATERPPH